VVATGRHTFRGHLADFIRDTMLAEGVISPGNADFSYRADTVSEALTVLTAYHIKSSGTW